MTDPKHGGDDDARAHFVLSRWLFLRALALVFALAFISLWVQIDALARSRGILPIADWLGAIRRGTGEIPWWRVPTLSWLSASDGFLHAQCALGVGLSIALFVGLAPRLTLALAWLVYLSLCTAGQDFLWFQWDTLLLETAVFAFAFAPGAWLERFSCERPPSRIALFLVRWLLFRLMLGSGLSKLTSGDPSWTDGSALTFHYFTQPIPNPLAWWMQPLPIAFQALSCWILFAIEIVLPFGCFGPRWARLAAALGFTFLMVLISATGNYGFFNLLTLVLCIPLVDDAVWARVLPRKLALRAATARPPSTARLPRMALGVFALAAVAISLPIAARRVVRGFQPPEPVLSIELAIEPLRSLNAYGLFAVMTRERQEIVIEGSDDGFEWRAYEFPYKPGAIDRAPPQVAPHMPRVDWQMWFAALGRARDAPWVRSLCSRILDGSPAVRELFAIDPFPDHPPRLVRVTLWDYRFTTREEHARGEGWWHRTAKGLYLPPLSLPPRTPFPR